MRVTLYRIPQGALRAGAPGIVRLAGFDTLSRPCRVKEQYQG
jgi:hypothetical protein